MQLSPEDIAAAEICGVSFIPASPAQVQRLAMQRKVFYRAGEPILATLGDGLYETIGTLQRLIEEGLRQQRDLAGWLQESAAPAPCAPAAVTVPVAPPDPLALPHRPDEPAALAAGPPAPVPGDAVVSPAVALPEDGFDLTMPGPPLASPAPSRHPAASTTLATGPFTVGSDDAGVAPTAAVPETSRRPRRAGRMSAAIGPLTGVVVEPEPGSPVPMADPPLRAAAASPHEGLGASPAGHLGGAASEQRGGRWLVAGAARRGRAGKHWSTRQR